MDITAQPSVASVEIRRTFKATREQVFDAWASENALSQWIGPIDEMNVEIEQHDFRVGGQYRYRLITKNDDPMSGPAGINHVAAGEFVTINRPTRLVFTWRWVENGMDIGETLVSLDFLDLDAKTELVLLHEKLPTPEARDAHRQGWQGWLACLDSYLHK